MRIGLLVGGLMWVGIITLTSGCSFHVADPFSDGDVMIVGDERGVNALSDMYAAAISEGKASPDKTGPYWQNRVLQTERRPLMISKPKEK